MRFTVNEYPKIIFDFFSSMWIQGPQRIHQSNLPISKQRRSSGELRIPTKTKNINNNHNNNNNNHKNINNNLTSLLQVMGPMAGLLSTCNKEVMHRFLQFLCTAVHAILSVSVSFSLISVQFFLASYPALRMQLIIRRQKRRKIEAEKVIITWTAKHRNGKIWYC